MRKNAIKILVFLIILFSILFIFNSLKKPIVKAGSYDGEDLAKAILKNDSWLISSSYYDRDRSGTREATVLSSLGVMQPTDGDSFALFSTGIAGSNPVTTGGGPSGDERGTWFRYKYSRPRDGAQLTMTLKVPEYMHYLCYHVQFFSSEWPEYVGSIYNDKLTIRVYSPTYHYSWYSFDVNSGYFVLDSNEISGSGFDIFAQSGKPGKVDIVDTIPRNPGADAGASDLIPIGGTTHPVSPGEEIEVRIRIEDSGDNLFDSAAFIDNMRFSGFARTEITSQKYIYDLNGGDVEGNDTLKYKITITNTGLIDQYDNDGNEFEDLIPDNTTYISGSAYSEYGTITYDSNNKKIIWNGEIPAETSRILEFKVKVNDSLPNGAIISNQGFVFWDSDEDDENDAIELTDDIHIDDGIDQDGDGETDDDDPTIVTVYSYDKPAYVTEDFSDDTPKKNASQFYLDRHWFETEEKNGNNSVFEVAGNYHYSTSKSFKTKLRKSDGEQYWNYYLSSLNGTMDYWELWFACGDTSEDYVMYINLQNDIGQDIAKLKFKYVNSGVKPMDWVLELYAYDSTNGWTRLNSSYSNGYLRNEWYKLKIQKNGTNDIDYILYMNDIGIVDSFTSGKIGALCSELSRVEFKTTTNPDPEICPIFFLDEHKIGLEYLN